MPEFEPETHALLARNAYNIEFAERVAFLAASREPHGLTADRNEFLKKSVPGYSFTNSYARVQKELLKELVKE